MVKLTGTIKNGQVVLDQRDGLPDGTRVSVEPMSAHALAANDDFWKGKTIAQLIQEQGVQPIRSIDDLKGGWPEDEINDGFEEELRKWRSGERS